MARKRVKIRDRVAAAAAAAAADEGSGVRDPVLPAIVIYFSIRQLLCNTSATQQ